MAAAIKIVVHISPAQGYFRAMHNGIQQYAREAGRPVQFLRSDVSNEHDVNRVVAQFGAVGAISQISSEAMRKASQTYTVPTVNVSNRYNDLPFPQVISDDFAVGRLAAQHFADVGYRNVTFGPIPRHNYSVEREAGMREQAAKLGLNFIPVPRSHYSDNLESILPSTLKAMGHWPRPLAVLCANDLAARRLVQGVTKMGLRVPQDIAVLGVDNDDLECEEEEPSLSSVALNGEAVGLHAAKTIMAMLEGMKVPSRTMLPPRGVMVRASSSAVACADPDIRLVVDWIRSQVHRGIHVRDLLRQTPMSRRTLELRFRAAMGVTPNEFIRREQVARATRLLATEGLSVKEVSFASGFSDPKQFAKVFKRMTGQCPSDYRSHANTALTN